MGEFVGWTTSGMLFLGVAYLMWRDRHYIDRKDNTK